MSERNSVEIPLNDQAKFRLIEINKIKNYFNTEIQERKTMSKKLSKYIAAFDYIDKNLIVLSATSGGINIISFTSVTGIPAEKKKYEQMKESIRNTKSRDELSENSKENSGNAYT